jgi:hypothetical protein
MAGTFADKATLATDNSFINKVKVALIFRANELINSTSAQSLATYDVVGHAKAIFQNAGSDAPSMAWRVAASNATIGAAAPAVPIDSDVQFAVNTILTALQ